MFISEWNFGITLHTFKGYLSMLDYFPLLVTRILYSGPYRLEPHDKFYPMSHEPKLTIAVPFYSPGLLPLWQQLETTCLGSQSHRENNHLEA